MPLVATRGAASAQGFGEFGAVTAVNYIESCFSTYLYTGNDSTQTITNGIDLSGKGGLVWIKGRSGATGHRLTDTARGATKSLESNSTAAEATESTGLTAFNGTGFSIGADADYNTNTTTYVSWTFRKQAKFFDVVTYTGNGANRTIAHNLGSVPGCIIVKRTDTTADWQVYHRQVGAAKRLALNLTGGEETASSTWNNTEPTSTVFSLGTDSQVNGSGGTYVAYLFAHNAGGFGLTGTDNVISCGIYTGNGSTTGTSVTLGYEPQWMMIKNSTSGSSNNWNIFDNMRGFTVSGQNDAYLSPNVADAEANASWIAPNATGFQLTTSSAEVNANANTYIYIAIRRGPMKVPTSGTSVYSGIASSANTPTKLTTNFPVDMQFYADRAGASYNTLVSTRLVRVATGALTSGQNGPYLVTSSTSAEATFYQSTSAWDNTGFGVTGSFGGASNIYWNFRRAPGFFDVVAYTGTGSARSITHNLSAVPELIIVKNRSGTYAWETYNATDGIAAYLRLNTTDGVSTGWSGFWGSSNPTTTQFSLGTYANNNQSSQTYIAYLFATCPGVSKVGSYTGTGTTKQIDCGFTGGARFVLIKRTDSTGDWYVWDSARGIVAGNDPYLLLNSDAAEVTSTDYIDTYSAGFEISSTAPAAINANGGTFIFLAIA